MPCLCVAALSEREQFPADGRLLASSGAPTVPGLSAAVLSLRDVLSDGTMTVML